MLGIFCVVLCVRRASGSGIWFTTKSLKPCIYQCKIYRVDLSCLPVVTRFVCVCVCSRGCARGSRLDSIERDHTVEMGRMFTKRHTIQLHQRVRFNHSKRFLCNVKHAYKHICIYVCLKEAFTLPQHAEPTGNI